jgi:hypothetical protein
MVLHIVRSFQIQIHFLLSVCIILFQLKHKKENGFEFEMNEQYGEPLVEGSYKLRNDIYDLDGDVLIKQDDTIELPNELQLDSIMGYDVFKYKNLYMTTEDVIYENQI